MPPLPGRATERRTSSVDLLLPAEGRDGPAPPWPSGHEPTDAEDARWCRLWKLPQAVAWERLNVAEGVELYVRLGCVLDEQLARGEPSAALLAQHVRLGDNLGMSPGAMARLRWTVAAPAEKPAPSKAKQSAAPPVRRLRPPSAPPGAKK